MSKLNISDLLNTISSSTVNNNVNDVNNNNNNNYQNQKNNIIDKNATSLKASKATQQFLTLSSSSNSSLKLKKLKKSQQTLLSRELNYKSVQSDMDKWVGIVKLNREKQTLDLSKKQKQSVKINFFPSKPISQLQKKTENVLKSLSMKNEEEILKNQQKELNKLDPQQAKKRLIQARKHRTAVFYSQIKSRRISKIKSKLYHRIKKRQKQRQQQSHIQNMSIHEKSQYIQSLTRKRIKQRINLRHNNKNKHIQNLLRFNKYNKDNIQQAMNQINQIRHKQLQRGRINEQMLDGIEQMIEQQYDEENFRQQAMEDLMKEIEQMENQDNQNNGNYDNNINNKAKGLDGMKFMKVAHQKKKNKDIKQAYRLLNTLENNQEIESNDINIDSDQDQHNQQNKSTHTHKNKQQQISRKVYGQNTKTNEQPSSKPLPSSRSHSINNFIKSNIKSSILPQQSVQLLIQGINIENLKQKYNSNKVDLKLQLSQQLIQKNRNLFNNNKNLIEGQQFQNNINDAVLQNLREFQQDKQINLQNDIQPQNKKLKGWGNWAGPNIKQSKIDPQLEIKKKLAKIQQIKRKRKDGELSNVIINQVRNKNLKDYMVRKLPHQFSTMEQFEYVNKAEIGPEWNSMNQFKNNIKPKVITKVGEVIQPIRMPKKVGKA